MSAQLIKLADDPFRVRVMGARRGIGQQVALQPQLRSAYLELGVAERCLTERGFLRCLNRAIDTLPKDSDWHATLRNIYKSATRRVVR
jgi:hypothetical protein